MKKIPSRNQNLWSTLVCSYMFIQLNIFYIFFIDWNMILFLIHKILEKHLCKGEAEWKTGDHKLHNKTVSGLLW
jgi:hypothetical protein